MSIKKTNLVFVQKEFINVVIFLKELVPETVANEIKP